ncbi:hypothetical protein SteCoe_36443 [Stentor coeruleus]|uniref:Uncharacterized protein n=1 Tax=Stentor coeruleus TaxID=5963 RepID=A0A1R2AQ49_9CILI|nr:hypothetical protein SteCoe_36443 [Stentor coeruleus]
MASKFLAVMIILGLCMGQDAELFGMVTKSGLNYDQVMAWSDSLWVEVESGILTPEQAQAMFLDETGLRVIDFLVRSGEIQLAVSSGLVPQEVVDDLVKG